MADKLIQTFTQLATSGSTYVFTHTLTAAGAATTPDEVLVQQNGAVWGATTSYGIGRLVAADTSLISVAIDGNKATNVGTVVVQAVKRHSIVNVT